MKKYFYLCLFFLQINYSQAQVLAFTQNFAKSNTKNTFLTASANINDNNSSQSFNVFHENDTLLRVIYKGIQLYKTFYYNVKIHLEDSVFINDINHVDFFSIRDNLIYTICKDSFIYEYYVNKEDNDIYCCKTNIDEGYTIKNKIVKLNKKEQFLAKHQLGDYLYLIVFEKNNNNIRTIKVQNSIALSDSKLEIKSKNFRTRGNDITTMGASLGNTLLNTRIVNLSGNKPSTLKQHNKFTAYIKDNTFSFLMENGYYLIDIFNFNFVQQTVEYQKLDTKITIPNYLLAFANTESTKTNNYFINTKSVKDGYDVFFNFDIYNVFNNNYLQSNNLTQKIVEKDSFVHMYWEKGTLTSFKKKPLKDNLKVFLKENTKIEVKEKGDTLQFSFQTFKSPTPFWKVVLSIATTITATYLLNNINAMPNLHGYAYFWFYGSHKLEVSQFAINYDVKQQKILNIENEVYINGFTNNLFSEIRKANAKIQQFAALNVGNKQILGLVDNNNKQFKVILTN